MTFASCVNSVCCLLLQHLPKFNSLSTFNFYMLFSEASHINWTVAGVGNAQAAQPGTQGQKRKRRLLLAPMDRDMERTVPPVSLGSEGAVQAQPVPSSHADAAAQPEGEEGQLHCLDDCHLCCLSSQVKFPASH